MGTARTRACKNERNRSCTDPTGTAPEYTAPDHRFTNRMTRPVRLRTGVPESASGGARPAGSVAQFEFRHPQELRAVGGWSDLQTGLPPASFNPRRRPFRAGLSGTFFCSVQPAGDPEATDWPFYIQSRSAGLRRSALVRDRCFLLSSRRWRARRPGSVGTRLLGFSAAASTRSARRSRASRRLRAWVRCC